eukprot:GHVQ01041425.1.p1 GENE.GHVQ01041425.1~~GHVQ01041425.1.p1  ORF type:complete len:244 (+),score=21.87 GHVQ01041425.1:112-843(+)
MPRLPLQQLQPISRLVLGPIIGLVTEHSARVLVETNQPCSATCVVRSQDGSEIKLTLSTVPCVPIVFKFHGLLPGTKYTVTFDIPYEVPLPTGSSFTTLRGGFNIDRGSASIAVVSCNKIYVTRDEVTPDVDLWRDLYKRIEQGSVDLVCHIGDNVYADADLYLIEKGKKVFSGGPKDDCKFLLAMAELQNVSNRSSKYTKCCEIFRQVYVQTWSHMPTRCCLANVPNIMILVCLQKSSMRLL